METTLRDPDTGACIDPRGDYWTRVTYFVTKDATAGIRLSTRIRRAERNGGYINPIIRRHQARGWRA
jgi:hypothetical protein